MRITNSMMVTNFNRNLSGGLKKMSKYQMQMATGKSIIRLSDNPVGAIKGLQARARIADIEQYLKNIDEAKGILTESETALSEINRIIQRSYELTVQVSSDTYSEEDRLNVSIELEQLKDQLLAAANSTYNSKYLFGGYNVTSVPFKVDPDTGDLMMNDIYNLKSGDTIDLNNAESEVVQYEIGQSLKIDATISGVRALGTGSNNLYYIMQQLCEAVNDPERISELNVNQINGEDSIITRLQEAQRTILGSIAECGGRQNRLDFMTDRYEDDILNYVDIQSKAEDIDLAETAMYFEMSSTVYNAALAVGSKIIQRTLVDFL